ncbi:macrolide ABC transporter ATP-binding protein [Acrocarpospora phusangensis]|uniref:Macrolide ABC transporter ATP-binding protein n=1 Tax=Acrocarpospora phusangensis TaxID=1070424 RepID=A0A919UII8_9ACTN|nr:ABC transporter ATP-binding protein [Acrocarpospora phusangensis]GIH22726.1 macrolide ABC transporter ATP-binding protein [Acrocarpospora phusangensis]
MVVDIRATRIDTTGRPGTRLAPVIRAHGLSRAYDSPAGPQWALVDATFTVFPGEVVTIMGPSGSGKSTLLHLLGLLDRPTTGTYALAGADTSTLTDRERAGLRMRSIGFVFQAFHLLAHKTVLANVTLPLLYARRPPAERRAAAVSALTGVGLAHRLHALPRTLSGGEKQRAGIARATVLDPCLLLCDEPTGNLDSAATAKIMDLLRARARAGLAVVVVTHDPAVARSADRMLWLADGRLSEVDRDG